MAGLVPAIYVFALASKTWMPATSAGMTIHSDVMLYVSTLLSTACICSST
jgi:hypothetical protein